MNKNYLDLERIKYESLSSFDQSLMISIEAIENLFNNLVKKDPYSDKIIWSMLDEVMLKASLINENYGLDEISQIINYIKVSLKNIIKSPKEKLIKVNTMQQFSKVQKINNKTMSWLGSQPGETLNEKIGVKGKVLAPINKYNLDKKENRIVLYFFRKIEEVLEIRYLGLKKQNEDMPEKFMKMYKDFSKLKRAMKEKGLYCLPMPLDFTPNNILIDHRNYSVVYRGFKKYKKYIESHNSRKEKILERSVSLIGLGVCSKLNNLEGFDLINEDADFLDLFDDNFSITKNDNINFLVEDSHNKKNKKKWFFDFSIKKNYLRIKIDEYLFDDNSKKAIRENKTNRRFSFELLSNDDFEINRGLKIKCKLLEKTFYLDNNGIKDIIHEIVDYICLVIKIKKSIKRKNKKIKIEAPFFNFTSHISHLNKEKLENNIFYVERKKFLKHNILLNSNHYKIENLSEVLDENKAVKHSFSNYLKKLTEDYNVKNRVLYPVPEILDETTQNILANSFTLNTDESFPIWRSILATSALTNEWFEKNDSLLVLDLNTFEPSINIVKNHGNLLEHHPPIYLEMDDLKLTLEDFLKEYLELYSDKYKLHLNNKEKEFILNSQKIYNVLFNHSNNKIKELIIRDDALFYLEKDDSLLKELEKKIDINIKKLFEKSEELINIKNEYNGFLLIGDHLRFNIKNLSQKKVNFISENELFDGSKIIRERINKKQIAWKEFLPNLSIEISKDSHFYDFELLKNKSSELKLGQEMKFKINEKLILPVTKNNIITFPIHTDNYNSKKEYNIEVSSKYFPLKEPMEVNLEIIYSYGGKTPYILKMMPCNSNFKSNNLEVTWVKNDNVIKLKKPKFPEAKNYDKNRIIKLLEQLNDDFIKIKPNVSDIYLKEQCEKFGKRLNSQKNILRGLVIQEIDNKGCIFDDLYNNNFIKNLIELCDINSEQYKNLKIKLDKCDRSLIEKYIYQIGSFLTSFGAIVLKDLDLKQNSRDQLKYRSLLFSTRYKMFNQVLELFKYHDDYNYKSLVSGLALNIWLDKDFLNEATSENPGIFKKSLKYLSDELFYLNKYFDKKIDKEKHKLWNVTNIFRDSLEIILALLRIEDEDLLTTQVGLTPVEVKKLIRLIKDIDRKIQFKDKKVKKMFDENSRLLFNINKLDGLKNMSDLAYVTYLHLTGGKDAELITIEVKEES